MRLIDGDALEKRLEHLWNISDDSDFANKEVWHALSEAPTIDAVPVVRCKNCKHGRPYKHTKEYVACEVDCEPIDRDSDFFCGDGERREDDE